MVSDGRIDSGSQIGAHYTFWATRRAAIEFAGGGRRFTDRDVGGELAVASWTVSLLRSYPTVLEPPGKKPRDVFRWWWGLGAGEATLSHSAATLTEDSVPVVTGSIGMTVIDTGGLQLSVLATITFGETVGVVSSQPIDLRMMMDVGVRFGNAF